MYLVEVMPIARGIFKDALHYFVDGSVNIGSLVSVPVRKRKIYGIVIDRKLTIDAKLEIKKAQYRIKKIEKIEGASFFTKTFMKTVNELSLYYASSPGQIISGLTPVGILENADKLEIKDSEATVSEKSKLKWPGALVYQANDDERFAFFKSRIREEFARNASVFFCLPTIPDILNAKRDLERGIEDHTIVLHSEISKKELILSWGKAVSSKHPVLIIATGSFLSIPVTNIGTIILDRENSPSYKQMQKPYIDIRRAALLLARELNTNLIIGDVVLRTETIYEKESGMTHPFSEIKYRVLSRANSQLVDMTNKSRDKTFSTLSNNLKDLIRASIENRERLFVFANRKGLSTYSVCSDCGSTLNCERCSAPLVLYRRKDKSKKLMKLPGPTFYLCHKCGQATRSDIECPKCNSWKLTPLGIGIEKIEDDIRKFYPTAKIFKIDSEIVNGYKHAQSIMKEFMSTLGSILIGTEMALLYFNKKVENIAVISGDSFFTLPDYRARERAINILMRLKLISSQNFLLQTRNPELDFFQYFDKGNLLNFYRDEIEDRKQYEYPPFVVLIKITSQGREDEVWKDIKLLEDELGDYGATSYPAFTPKIKNLMRAHILIRIKKSKWPDLVLLQILRNLPERITVNVNPNNLL